jgi:hypothetical protein
MTRKGLRVYLPTSAETMEKHAIAKARRIDRAPIFSMGEYLILYSMRRRAADWVN